MEIQQSPLYEKYIQSLGWTVIHVEGSQIFLRRFPFVGGLAKIQRTKALPNPKTLIPILKNLGVKTIAVEADSKLDPKKLSVWQKRLAPYFKFNRSAFLPTKTILIDLGPNETEIFNRFTEAKQRAVRRAQKNNLQIRESDNIRDLINIKNKSAGFLGFITTYGVDKLWKIFAPKHATTLLAYTHDEELIGGVLLLFWDDIAYYWIAGATQKGKKLFAPTWLVWESLRLAKKRGAKLFDFVGVWDERLVNENTKWQGFTKFKEGFGGFNQYYPILNYFPKTAAE